MLTDDRLTLADAEDLAQAPLPPEFAERCLFREPPLRARRIAIVGYAPTCQPPESVWDDPGVEKWVMNHGHNLDPAGRWDRLFEFHGRDVIDDETRRHHRGADQWAVLQAEARRPVYMREAHADVPCSVRFPLADFVRFFGAGCGKLARRPYVEMAAGYMLGYAVMLLCGGSPPQAVRGTEALPDDEILVYGFELFDGEEYSHQRSCFEFYAGYALGAGIRVQVPETSAIFATRGLYEYDTGEAARLLNQADLYLQQRHAEAARMLREAKERNDQAVAEMQTASAIMQETARQQGYVRHLLKGGNYAG